MGPIEIYIFGDLDFAYFILNGITMMYANDSSFIKAAFVLSLLFLLWSFIKWSMNPEKNTYPVREWAFGLIFFMIFGGSSISPKVDVQLHSAISPGYFKSTITDVPVLAAIPSWLSTNLFYSISKVINETGALNIPGYELFRGNGITAKPDSEPLQALVRLYTFAETTTLPVNEERAIKDYLEQCYIPELALSAEPQLKFEKTLLTQPLWPDFKVTNQHLTVNSVNFVDGKPIQGQKCTDNYEFINNHIKDDEGKIRQSATSIVKSRGVDPDEIKFGFQMINTMLAGTETSPNPSTITTNMFLARTLKDTISQSPAAQTYSVWAQKMVFEGERKRTFDAAGEKALFEKLYIPTITAVETFSFYIAPILMILSILGGFGFAYIGKYLQLVLFINLWSFVRPFVDVFTALALSKAFKPDGSITDQLNSYISISTYPQTASEIDAMLTMASNLTMAIPFFSMFLLYGGVHSMMGVMRTVTGGNTDSSNMAPTMATSMNGSAFVHGDTTTSLTTSNGSFATTHQAGSNALFGNQSVGSDFRAAHDNASGTLKALQLSAGTAHNKALTDALGTTKLSALTQSDTTGENASSSAGFQQLISTTDSSVGSLSSNLSKEAQVLAQLVAGAAIKAGVGGSEGASEKINPENPGAAIDKNSPKSLLKSRLMSLGLDANLAAQFSSGISDSEAKSLNQLYSTTKANAQSASSQQGFDKSYAFAKMNQFSDAVKKDEALQTAYTTGQQIQNLKTSEASLSNSTSKGQVLSTNKSLEFHRAAPTFGMNEFEKFYNSLQGHEKSRIGQVLDAGNPPMNATDVALKVQDITGAGPSGFNGAFISSNILGLLHNQDKDIKTTSNDFMLASKFYSEVGKHAGDYKQAFNMAAEISKSSANATKQIQEDFNARREPEVGSAAQAQDKIDNAKFNDPINKTNPNNARVNAAPGLQTDGVPTKQTPQTGGVQVPTRDDANKIKNELGPSASNVANAKTLMTPLTALQNGFFNTIGDVSALFSPARDERWGSNIKETNERIEAYAAKQLGVQSGQIQDGLTSLTKSSTSHEINQLFTDLGSENPQIKAQAAQKISAMNDAATLLSTKEGASAVFQAYSPEDGARLIQNAEQFKKFMSARDPEQTTFSEDFFNALSRSRISGAITDDSASAAILSVAYMGSGAPIPNSSARSGGVEGLQMERSSQALSWALNADDSTFKGTEDANIIRQSIYPEDKSKTPTPDNKREKPYIEQVASQQNAEQYRSTALQHYIDDTQKQSLVAGIMLDDNTFTAGYNATDKQSNINQATPNYVRKVIENDGPVSDFNNSLIMKSTGVEQSPIEQIFGLNQNKLMDRQEAVFVNSTTTSPSDFASRLGDVGFKEESVKIQEAVQDLTQQAKQANIVIDRNQLESNYIQANDKVDALPSISQITNRN